MARALSGQPVPVNNEVVTALPHPDQHASQEDAQAAADPFRWFDSSPEVIRLVVMMYVKYPLSLRNVEDLLHERGIEICHETVRLWWRRFGPMFANEIRRKRVQAMRQQTQWRWHLDEVYVRINGEMRYLWRAVDHEGEGAGVLCHQVKGQGCSAEVHQEGPEAARLA